MSKKIRGSLFHPLKIGSPDLLTNSRPDFQTPQGKRISRDRLVDILNFHSVQYNDGLIDDLQDLSERTKFDSKDVQRVFLRNALPVPVPGTLGKITGAIKDPKTQKPINLVTEKPDAISISLTSPPAATINSSTISPGKSPIIVISRSQLPDLLKLLATGETEQVSKFPGTDFELTLTRYDSLPVNNRYDSLLTSRDRELFEVLSDVEDPEFQKSYLADYPDAEGPDLTESLQRAVLQLHADKTAEQKPQLLNPNDKNCFDRVAWFYHFFSTPITRMLNDWNPGENIPKDKMAPVLRNVLKHLNGKLPAFDVEELLASRTEFTPEEFSSLSGHLIASVIRPLGIFNPKGVHGEALALSFPSLTKKIKTPGGIEVPVSRTFSLFGEYGAAFAWKDSIAISSEMEKTFEMYRQDCRKWWSEFQAGKKWPSLAENPVLIMPWVYMNAYGEVSLEEGEKLYEDFLLAEEVHHVDTLQFIQSCKSTDKTCEEHGYNGSIIKHLLKEDDAVSAFNTVTLNKDLDNLQSDPIKQDEKASEIIELEGKLGALEITPLPEVELVEGLLETILPVRDPGENQFDMYLNAQNYYARLLSQQFFGFETLDKNIWVSFLAENLKDKDAIKAFRPRIQEAARKVREERFLTTAQKDAKNPNWRTFPLNIA